MVSVAHTASPLEVFGSSLSILTFVMLVVLLALSLNDQRIVATMSPDEIDRIVASNAVINEILRLILGTAILIVWLSAVITPPYDSEPQILTPIAVALVTMFPVMQLTLLVWGIKDFVIRRRLLHGSHNDKHAGIILPPDFPPGK